MQKGRAGPCFLRGQAQHLVLVCLFGGQIAKAGYAHSVWQPPFSLIIFHAESAVVGPFLQIDAPLRWFGRQEERVALRSGQAAWDTCLGMRHQFLGIGKDFPQPHHTVSRRRGMRLPSGLNSALITASA